MAQTVYEAGEPFAITQASTTVAGAVDGAILGVLVSTSATGTLSITDARGRAICVAMPLVAGQWIPIKAKFIGALTLAGTGTFAATLVIG